MVKLKSALTVVAAAFLLVGSAFAADVTGKWSGTVSMKTPDGQTNEQPAWLALKQSGTALTGTAGPSADRQSEIKDGKIDGDQLEFRVKVEDAVVMIKLRSEGERLKGQAIIETPDGTVTAGLDLKRVP